ncbi:hypothetical protein V144x_08240 [Gimesia aquarii]|uniref:Uncharacterized protein n=1 Tax=Gimesia aquarii TaxID=2527964 RepID=A0A517VQU3_9PLAN|nr:hypothetical protein V144x_08240 [Gimesia aquarii]
MKKNLKGQESIILSCSLFVLLTLICLAVNGIKDIYKFLSSRKINKMLHVLMSRGYYLEHCIG